MRYELAVDLALGRPQRAARIFLPTRSLQSASLRK